MLTVRSILNAKSALSLKDQVNHNCLIGGVELHPEYGIIIRLRKITTNAMINIDIASDMGYNVVLSEGRHYQRYTVDARVLWQLRPSVRTTIELLINLRTDQGSDQFAYDMASVLIGRESTKHACTPDLQEYIQELAEEANQKIPEYREIETLVIE